MTTGVWGLLHGENEEDFRSKLAELMTTFKGNESILNNLRKLSILFIN